MGNGIKARIVKIGNSQGVRIPKLLLEQAALGEEVEIEVRGAQLVISPIHSPRADWDDAFSNMALKGDDRLLDTETSSSSSWDDEEWDW
ncbi:MAG: AbrB/MazE/SpoVT family DNA-binding domain-containing protein [Chloroflexota bacterium]|nr:AbrB/MazE/SpoVT family DNA-binding domain-containing protein [Chloroflexota bacterium]